MEDSRGGDAAAAADEAVDPAVAAIVAADNYLCKGKAALEQTLMSWCWLSADAAGSTEEMDSDAPQAAEERQGLVFEVAALLPDKPCQVVHCCSRWC